ncbi:MAG: FkbM family methyltransferase, partial [Bacteroidota bacterium]
SGKKAAFITKIGQTLLPNANVVNPFNVSIQTTGHNCAAIIRYAPYNFFYDFHKSDLGEYLTLCCNENDVFVDVGANLGGYSFMAKRLGLQVYAFEPFPELAQFLESNSDAYGKVFPIALSDSSGNLKFHISDSNTGGSSLVESTLPDVESGYSRRTLVEVRRGDEILDSVGKIRLLKIDVEGNEEKTVKGFHNLFKANKIQSVWCEVRGPKSDRNANSYIEVCNYLAQFGFMPFLYKNGNTRPFKASAEGEELDQFFDLLFEQAVSRV